MSQNQCENYVTTDDQSASLSWFQPPSGAQDQIVATVRHLRFCWCGAPSLTRGLFVVYNCCWSSTAQSFSGPGPAGLMTIFNCLRFETPPTWRARSPYLYHPGTGWPSYTPRYWVPFSSPPTTRRAMVEVFEPASARGLKTESESELFYDRRFTANQFVLAPNPLGVTARDFFPNDWISSK
jgi:hypothetical protein